MFTWLFGDRGIPANYRQMDGFGSHTFSWTNARGEQFYVKYHFKTDQGIATLTTEDGVGSRVPTRNPTTAICSRQSNVVTAPRGRSRFRSCPSPTPTTTASTRSTSPRFGHMRTTH